jgi:hypothetical protein
MEEKDFAREALAWFFRRRTEAGTLYCAACLVQRLIRRAQGPFSNAAAQAAVAETFDHPTPLRVTPHGPCAICRKRRPCLGTVRPGL